MQDVMHRIQERRPNSGYNITTQDSELVVHAVLHGLSDEKSCKTLMATLLSNVTKLANIASLRKRLVTEDISHNTTTDLYGLKKSDHSMLLASPVPTTTAGAGTATTNKPNENKKEHAKCTYEGCGGRHPTESCYKKIIADLKSCIDDTSAVTKSVRFNNSAHSAATTTTAAALSANAGSMTMARAQLSSVDDVADGLWIADTGATAHMMPHRVFFVTYEPCSTPVHIANGNIVHAAGVGTVVFVPRLEGVDKPAVGFTKVLQILDLQCNLLSVLYLVRNSSIVVHAEGDSMSFAQNGTVLFRATINDGCAAHLDGVTARTDSVVASAYRATIPTDLALWHRRTMHHHLHGLDRAIRDKLVTGITLESRARPDPICEPCLAGKMHARPFSSTGTITTGVLDLVHSDLVQMPTASMSGYRYFIAFHNDASVEHCSGE